jgi:16S rRNA (guanine527-N7)-methyltransferase
MDALRYFEEGLSALGLELPREQSELMLRFQELVLAKNKVMNLTAVTDEKAFIETHLIDSLSVLPYLKNANRIIDIGSGAGFPGILLKIAMPQTEFLLLDSLQKRVRFLEESAEILGLERITFLHARAEDAAKISDLRETFDVAVSRAVATLPVLNELCIPFVKPRGCYIAMKGNNYRDEYEESKRMLQELGADEPKIYALQLPYSKAERNLLVFRKTKKTPMRYPRSPKQIKAAFGQSH